MFYIFIESKLPELEFAYKLMFFFSFDKLWLIISLELYLFGHSIQRKNATKKVFYQKVDLVKDV